MRRLYLLLTVTGLLFAGSLGFAQQALGQSTDLDKTLLSQLEELQYKEIRERLTEGFQRYEKQLQAVMKARFNEEKDFISQVSLMVQEEKIPKNLVDSAWLWVRKNRANSPYPFIYFERVLRLQAEKADFVLPKFDRKIYQESIAERRTRQTRRR